MGTDGTIVLHDSCGYVYALRPNGGLKWIFPAGLPYGPPSIGADVAVYVGTGRTVKAIDGASGALRWEFTDTTTGSLWIAAGPTVGPDDNIYVVFNTFSSGGMGVPSATTVPTCSWSRWNRLYWNLFLLVGASASGD